MNAFAPSRGHDIFEALAVAWAMAALEPADQVIFEEHYEGCPICEQTVQDTLEIAAELAYGVPDIEPPPQLRRRILAAATPRPPAQGSSPEDGPAGLGGPAGFAALDLFGDSGRAGGRRDVPHVLHPGGGGAGSSNAGGGGAGGVGTDGDGAGRVGTGGGGAGGVGTDGDGGSGGGPGAAPRKVGGGRPVRGRHAVGARRAGQERPAGRSASRRRRIASVLAAAALVGISAVTTWEVTRPAAVTAPVAAPDRMAVLSPPAGQGTVATVVVRGGRADVVTDALDPNAEGRSFYVWGVPAGGNGSPQVVGTFQVTTSGLHSYPVNLTHSLDGYPVLAISEEPTGSTPAAPSGVLARGALGH